MIARLGLFGALLLLAAVPAAAAAQERSCRQVLPSDARRLLNARGQELIYFRDPVRVLCTGGLQLEADSAVMNRTAGTVLLVGNVVYRDSLRQLTADWANFIGERDQLLARGAVVLRALEDGSVVRGDELDYLRETPLRPRARMVVRGGRPYATVPPPADSTGAPPDTAMPTEVWADRMEFEGDSVFRGMGAVDLRRGDMTGAGDTVVFDQREERMTLTVDAFVQTDRYRLEGARIDAFTAGRELRSVLADRDARVDSDELAVDADRIRIGLVDGRLDRMEAWNPAPDSAPRALADAGGFRLRADSIDARADSMGLREVRAVGRAYGERDIEATARALPAAAARDWIQGDTILGYFGRRPVVAADPERQVPDVAAADGGMAAAEAGGAAGAGPRGDSVEVVLERIVVVGGGGPALSLYRMRAEGRDGAAETAINFVKAARITMYMEQGDVTHVEADGPLEGLHLAPNARSGEAGSAGPPGGGVAGGMPNAGGGR